MRKLVLLLIVSLSAACSWVPLSGDGQGVQILANNEVLDCDRVGNTKATVLRKLWIVPRRSTVVERELETLARNEAAKLGGNTVTPLGQEKDGKQAYAVYVCGD